MAIEIKTTAQLDAESIEDMARNGVVSDMSDGSRARTIHQIINRRLGKAYESLQFNRAMGFLDSSNSYFLDLLGPLVGVSRRTATTGIVDREDENIKFYVTSGYLKDKLPGLSIPVGTTITNDAGTITYTVTEAAGFGSLDTFVYVTAVAPGPGGQYRCGRNVLKNSSLGISGLYVTNLKEVTSGDDPETDDNFKYRIANSRAVRESSNITAIRIAMLPVPGVSDIIMQEYAGYVDALIIPSGNRVSRSMIMACQLLGNKVKATGIRLSCRGPEMVTFEILHHIQIRSDVPREQYQQVQDRARRAVLNYFDDIPLGGEFILRQYENRIISSDPRIHDHRTVCLNFRRRPQLHRNFRLRRDELFMPDPESTNAVVIAVV